MLRRVFQTIRRQRMWPDRAHLLVAVSGGADSIALLHALHHWRRRHPLRLTVVHLHHGIRGRAADQDRDFVQQMAWKLGLSCIESSADVPALAKRSGRSIEMAARAARHDFFRRAMKSTGAYAVAIAHTADDEAETLLLRLLRGSGLQGLGGIAPVTTIGDLRVVRPLLDVTRSEIESFLRTHGLAWREDATNRDTAILRNKVRHVLLPFLEKEFQPAIRRVLCRTAGLLRDDQALILPLALRAASRATQTDGSLSIQALRALAPGLRRRVLIDWLRANGVSEARLDFNLVGRAESLVEGGAIVALADGLSAGVVNGRLIVSRKSRAAIPSNTIPLPIPGLVAWQNLTVSAEPAKGIIRPPRSRVGVVPAEATVRPPKRGERLSVRGCWPGARIAPVGLEGSIKLQDLFVDHKVPRGDRAQIPIVTCGKTVVWVPGYRIARAWAVPGENARSVRLCVEPE